MVLLYKPQVRIRIRSGSLVGTPCTLHCTYIVQWKLDISQDEPYHTIPWDGACEAEHCLLYRIRERNLTFSGTDLRSTSGGGLQGFLALAISQLTTTSLSLNFIFMSLGSASCPIVLFCHLTCFFEC